MADETSLYSEAQLLLKKLKEEGVDDLVEVRASMNHKNLEIAHEHNKASLNKHRRSISWKNKDESQKKMIGKKNSANKKRLEASLDDEALKKKKEKEADQRKKGRFEQSLSKKVGTFFPSDDFEISQNEVRFHKVQDSTSIPPCMEDIFKGWTYMFSNGCGRCNGEHTPASVMKLVNAMIAHLGLNPGSIFLDVGSGCLDFLLRTSQFPRPRLSIGIEVDLRIYRNSVINLMHATEKCLSLQERDPTNQDSEPDKKPVLGNITAPMCLVLNNDAVSFIFSQLTQFKTPTENHCSLPCFLFYKMNLSTFAPVTDIFSFDATFSSKEMSWLGCVWSNSLGTKSYVSTKTENEMKSFGFENIKLVAAVPMKMKGSKQTHTHYLYKRTGPIVKYTGQCDNLFKGVWKTFKDGREAIIKHNLQAGKW